MEMEITTRDEVKGVQMWMAHDLWCVLGFERNAFHAYVEQVGWGATWSALLNVVRQIKPPEWRDREPTWR